MKMKKMISETQAIELNRMYHEKNLETMSRMADNSVDSIVTDPPYGLKFMGKKWDYDVPPVEVWKECLRVLKPGGYLLAFAGTRTQHRMAVRIEDAGFEIRDMIAWVYGSGFPKSLDVSKQLDKMAGMERQVVGESQWKGRNPNGRNHGNDTFKKYGVDKRTDEQTSQVTAPSSDAAKEWQGWGTALKPALEPITVARKPIVGTVAANVLKWGTGGINIDGCRVGESGARNNGSKPAEDGYQKNEIFGKRMPSERVDYDMGRFPSNLIHDGSEEVLALFPETTSGAFPKKAAAGDFFKGIGAIAEERKEMGDSGSAARFFYTAKASQSERGKGNDHPTVKPLAIMRYLCRLVTQPGGIIYDPYAGSGTTIIAAIEEGFSAFGSDLDAHHCDIFNLRTRHGVQPKMF